MSAKTKITKKANVLDRRVSIAPMMDCTDRHDRYFLRLISSAVLLYTEMITTGAILHGERDRFLKYNQSEHPLALQLGGSDPGDLARCAEIASEYGYDEVNLNVGCPSDRVQNGKFGVCLMKEPEVVANCIRSMREAVDLPVTVKTRIGVDNYDSWDEFVHFIETVANGGCDTFIIHARKAWLNGLSPKENREIPPLCYETVYRLKQKYPEFSISINGGIMSVAETATHLRHVDGVMIGRAAYQNPWFLSEIENEILNGTAPETREVVLDRYIEYVDHQIADGVPFYSMARHVLGLYNGMRGARLWRRYISEKGPIVGANSSVLRYASSQIYGQ